MPGKHLLPLLLIALSLTAPAQVRFDVQGQRGARGILPENTIGAMFKALELGVHTLNINVVVTKDSVVVLSHEPYFNNEITTTPQGKTFTLKDEKKYNIYAMDYAEVKKFDVGLKPHPRFPGQRKVAAYKPALAQLIDSVELYVKKHKLPKPDYNIETKTIPNGDGVFHPEPGAFVTLIMQVIKEKKLEKRTIIQSFDMRTLQYLHKHYPGIRTCLMVDEEEDFEKNIRALGFTPDIYSPYAILAGKSLIDRCHAAGVKIIPWTVNTSKEIIYLMKLGVDGIITDYPNLMAIVREELKEN